MLSDEIIKNKIANQVDISFCGLVSEDLPLLSSLNVLDNILLVDSYNRKLNDAKNKIIKLFEKLDMLQVLQKNSLSLSAKEKFVALFVRACFVNGSVLIERPSSILLLEKDSYFLDKVLLSCEDFFHKVFLYDLEIKKDWYVRQYE